MNLKSDCAPSSPEDARDVASTHRKVLLHAHIRSVELRLFDNAPKRGDSSGFSDFDRQVGGG